MAPTKTGKKSNKASGKTLGASKDSKARVSKPSSKSSSGAKRPPPKEQKSKRPALANGKKQRRHYTEKELGVPQLNMVTPIGVAKPKGKKKGKVFIDDPLSMMTIMAMVNAEKEGQIESKMLRARQMEEIHVLKRQEQEEREAARREKLEDAKDSLRKKRIRKGKDIGGAGAIGNDDSNGRKTRSAAKSDGKKKKRVSFG